MLITFDNRTFKTQLKSTSYCNMYVQSMLIEKQKTNRTKHKLGWCKIRIQNTYQQTKETYLHTIKCSHCCLPFYQNYQTLKTQRSCFLLLIHIFKTTSYLILTRPVSMSITFKSSSGCSPSREKCLSVFRHFWKVDSHVKRYSYMISSGKVLYIIYVDDDADDNDDNEGFYDGVDYDDDDNEEFLWWSWL